MTHFSVILTDETGGDLASTWVTKLEGHVEDVTTLVKNVANQILAKNDNVFAGDAAYAVAA